MGDSLFKLADDYNRLFEALVNSTDEETGEVDIDIAALVEKAQGTFEEKAVATATVYRKLDVTGEDIDDEIKRLKTIKDHIEKEKSRVKNYLSSALNSAGVESIKGIYANLSFRKSVETVIENEALLPKEFVRTKLVVTPDKVKIKEALEAGREVQGAKLVEKKNLQIK